MGDNIVAVYVTFSSDTEATACVKTLLDEKLIACGNVFPPHKSYYNWYGRVEDQLEVAVIMKTRKDLFPKMEERLAGLHSYECPCIVSMDITAGHTPYLAWVAGETR